MVMKLSCIFLGCICNKNYNRAFFFILDLVERTVVSETPKTSAIS